MSGRGRSSADPFGGAPIDDLGRLPWEQQVGEPDRWFSRFQTYLDLGPIRSVVQVYRAEKGRDGHAQACGRWKLSATRWRWTERARAYDAHQRQERQRANLAALDEAREGHLRIARQIVAKALEFYSTLDPATLTPDQGLRLLEAGVSLERKCLEEPAVAELQRIVDNLTQQTEGQTS